MGEATLEVSQKVYAVAIDPETLEVNWAETEKRRQERRRDVILGYNTLSKLIPPGD
jgi:hypothetical protein